MAEDIVLIQCWPAPKTDIGGGQMGGKCGRRKISCSASFPSDVLAIAAGPEIAILPAL